MFHLTNISWAQLLLIEIGALFLLVAFSAAIRGAYAYRDYVRSTKEEEEEAEASGQELEPQTADQAAPVPTHWTPDANRTEQPRTEMKASHLLRTAKVNFVQGFKFRLSESQRQLIES